MKVNTVYDVAIVGAGSMGMAAVAYLAGQKQKVILIDAYDPPHVHGSHHGDTRMIRHAYGEGGQYVSLVKRAQELWEELEERSTYKVFEKTGVIGLGPKHSEFIKEAIEAAERYGLPLDVLSSKQVNERWTGFSVPDDFIGCFESSSGLIYSENAIRAYKEIALENGAELLTNTRVQNIDKSIQDEVTIVTAKGKLRARKVIVTAGAWAQKLLPDLQLPIQPTRRAFGWFEAPNEIYDMEKFPSFYVEADGHMCYGFPNVNGTGLKIGRSDGGHPIDPDKHKQDFGQYKTDETDLREFLSAYLPQADGELLQGKTCMYTNSPDTDFIIDTHPDHEEIIFACGFSGHGFKFASSLGEALGELAITGTSTYDLSIFSLERFKNSHG